MHDNAEHAAMPSGAFICDIGARCKYAVSPGDHIMSLCVQAIHLVQLDFHVKVLCDMQYDLSRDLSEVDGKAQVDSLVNVYDRFAKHRKMQIEVSCG